MQITTVAVDKNVILCNEQFF